MNTPGHRIHNVSMRLQGEKNSYVITMVNDSRGRVNDPNFFLSLKTDILQIELLLSDEKVIWSGKAKFSKLEQAFSLLVDLDNNADYFLWEEIPESLSIFDGGYALLADQLLSDAIEDLLQFPNVVSSQVHFKTGNSTQILPIKFPEQESLKNVSEFLCLLDPGKLKKDEVCVLELKIFERTLFFISVLEDFEDEQHIFRLTPYVYLSLRRAGNRVPVLGSAEIRLGGGIVREVSDFGLKLESAQELSSKEVSVKIDGVGVKFSVVYSKPIGDGRFVHGLSLSDDSVEIRKSWQRFILPHQFPDLKYRTKEYHEKFWQLYYDTGYMEFSYTKYLEQAKTEVFRTWSAIDECGPGIGGSAFAEEDGKFVSSIGVSKLGGGICVAQAANTIAEPKYLKHTRSMYAWRTRFMLQQSDSTFHLAFLHREKKFLDRFFRSFYLKKNDKRILWDEWNLFVLENIRPNPNSDGLLPKPFIEGESCGEGATLLEKLATLNSGNFSLSAVSDGTLMEAPPHLHMMQYLTGIWSPEATLSPDEAFSPRHKFFSYYTRQETEKSMIALQKFRQPEEIIHEGWHVTWMCPRALLDDFLSNSLRSLEIMNRKYQGGTAA